MRGADSERGAMRRRVSFFSAAEAPLVHQTGVMETRSGEPALQGLEAAIAAGLVAGATTRLLYRSDIDDITLVYAWFRSNLPLPPHTHNVDCLYYIVAGSLIYGNRTLGQGDGFFVPANVPYAYTPGPNGLEILEYRNSTAFDIKTRDGTPSFWKRVIQTCVDNRSIWEKEAPPVRTPNGLG